jgi:uncharacterized protein (DUF488 family)
VLEWSIFTFGYQGRDVSELVKESSRLRALVVDVRIAPGSKIKGWSQHELQSTLGSAYTWIRELGNKAVKAGGIELLDGAAGYAKLARLLMAHRTVILLCACAKLDACHRKHIADEIAAAFPAAGEALRIEHLEPWAKPIAATQERLIA